MKEIILDSGLKSYCINGCEITFNPTDMAFAERLMSVFYSLDEKTEEMKKAINAADSPKEYFELSRTYDKEMRTLLDTAVGGPVSNAVAGDVNIYARSDGLPIFVNIILALIDEMDNGIASEMKRENPRMEEYLRKYKRRK